ncbi:hypothetical protein QR98_0023020 [Sarcoptes scabiei]|uniref:Uncharacterized protein n=1 Tax=Sarcoptes scabiei TaxID=52283 RepID=A0A132A000_SARSC|nr:hypothetical protein QR98_0023020 [Sarcoptes scabiei]
MTQSSSDKNCDKIIMNRFRNGLNSTEEVNSHETYDDSLEQHYQNKQYKLNRLLQELKEYSLEDSEDTYENDFHVETRERLNSRNTENSDEFMARTRNVC